MCSMQYELIVCTEFVFENIYKATDQHSGRAQYLGVITQPKVNHNLKKINHRLLANSSHDLMK